MRNGRGITLRIIVTIILLAGLLYLPAPALSQETLNLQNLIRNGNFEQGFQGEAGVGAEWRSFSNGSALAGWSADTWPAVVAEGQNAQLIQLHTATELDRYAGIYQTVRVVPGQQYKLTIKGLIRSTEGDIVDSNYGYRLQYAIDYNGGAAWELLSAGDWQELPWDEQPLGNPTTGSYRIDNFSTTITAQTDQLTLFIRAWKKWVDNGTGLYNLDEISLIGPPVAEFEVPAAQAAVVNAGSPANKKETAGTNISDAPVIESEVAVDLSSPSTGSIAPAAPAEPEPVAGPRAAEQLPVSGQGQDTSISYVLIAGVGLILMLLVSALTATLRWYRHQIQE